ncbi:MAG TPA: sensor domain-containing protein [Candidatus Limnocylindrales bacterium]
MIGGAVLVLGLLLILTGLVSGLVPGEAAFASPGIAPGEATDAAGRGGALGVARRARNPIRAFLLSPVHPATWYAFGSIVLGVLVAMVAFFALVSCVSAGFASLLAGVGLLFFVLAIEGSRLVARLERWRATRADRRPLDAHPYRPLQGSVGDVLRAEFADDSRWRDVLYVAVNFPLAALEFAVVVAIWSLALWLLTMPLWYDASPGAALPPYLDWLADRSAPVAAVRALAGAALLPVAASVTQLVTALHRAVVDGLLCTSESRELRRQVATLKASRSTVLDVEASELRRIERDLHDGAQQRLVMLTIDLGLASERIDSDPEGARKLVIEGQEQARQALAELRDLVRGIAPAILLDRGLVAALDSIAARSPVPTVVRCDLAPGTRLPDAIERAAYFVAAEALANVAKHSSAGRCEVRCRGEGPRFLVEVWDDGVGGAKAAPGGGLTGLAGRVEAVDGGFSVSSPPGGPTLVRAEFPVLGGRAAEWSATQSLPRPSTGSS